jgi:hypothetical protein
MNTFRKNQYIGHSSQLSGVKEYRLIGGKGDGMRQLEVQNGLGLQMTINADRAADIVQVWLRGDNFSYISPVGEVAPAYYDDKGAGFLKSFTAGFLTTCGLEAVGAPCVDEGESLPLHGKIGNTPCEQIYWREDDENITIHATINQSEIFGAKLYVYRTITCSKTSNTFSISDEVENMGDTTVPLMLMYHINLGYPLLSEKSELFIPSSKVTARDARAEEGIDTWNQVIPPTQNFTEQCYFHEFAKEGLAALYNHDIQKGIAITFDTAQLDTLTQWKMMGVKDYVMGLEPGNCNPSGRDVMRKEGKLKFIRPMERMKYDVEVALLEGDAAWGIVKQGE